MLIRTGLYTWQDVNVVPTANTFFRFNNMELCYMQISQDVAYGIMRCKLFLRGRRHEGHLFYLRDTRRRTDSSEPFDLLVKNRSGTGETLNGELAPKIPLKISQDRT